MSRQTQLIVIALAAAAGSIVLYGLGVALDASLVRFAGLMVGATTFVPLPADTFVLSASAGNSALAIGAIGGSINAVMVLLERRWLLILVDHPWFARFSAFFDTNRLVALTERNMFLALVIGGASFIPFEPFRLIAVLRHYPPIRYFVATLLSRGGRYYVLASAGTALLEVGLLRQAIWLTLLLFAFGLWRSALKVLRGSQELAAEGAADAGGPEAGGADEGEIDRG